MVKQMPSTPFWDKPNVPTLNHRLIRKPAQLTRSQELKHAGNPFAVIFQSLTGWEITGDK
jgi:hypothetical protein